jgi:flagellar hook-length control protein FliK
MAASKVQTVSYESVAAAQSVIKETGLGQEVAKVSPPQAENQPVDLVQQIVSQMGGSIQRGQSSIKIQLHPQDLGTIDIQLVNSGHGVSVTVSAEQASTGRLLQSQADQLRQSLQDSGVQLSSLNINQHGQPSQHGSAPNQQPQHSYPSGRNTPHTDAESQANPENPIGRITSGNLIEYLI